jgi:hypothetical protein
MRSRCMSVEERGFRSLCSFRVLGLLDLGRGWGMMEEDLEEVHMSEYTPFSSENKTKRLRNNSPSSQNLLLLVVPVGVYPR